MDSLRYARQIQMGWKQELIEDTTVAVLGDNSLFVSLFLTYLGYNNILAITNGQNNPLLQGRFLDIELEDKPDAKNIETIMKKMHPDSNCFGQVHDLSGSYLAQVVARADIVVETRQDPKLRESTLSYVQRTETPAVFISNQGNAVVVHTYTPRHTLVDNQREKSFFVSTAGNGFLPFMLYGASAYAAGEVLQHTLGLGAIAKDPFIWNLQGDDPFWFNNDHKFNFDLNDFKHTHIAQIGAGGTGVNTAYQIAAFIQPDILFIVDYDTVDPTNLNRQFPYYNSLDKSKVEELARVLSNVSRTKVIPIHAEFNEDFDFPGSVDLLVDSSSGFVNQLRAHNFALQYDIPSAKVAVNTYEAQVNKLTRNFPCFNHQYGIYDKAVHEALLDARPGCDQNPIGSNIIVTALGSALLLGEIPSLLLPDKYNLRRDQLYHRMLKQERAFSDPIGDRCTCRPRRLTLPTNVTYVDDANEQTQIYIGGKLFEPS